MEHVVGSLRIRDNDTCLIGENGRVLPKLLPVGWKLKSDLHCFDHMTYVVAGKFACEKRSMDGAVLFNGILSAPDWLNVAANEYHDFECLEPGILHCIFASRDPVTHEVSDTPTNFSHASGLQSADWLRLKEGD